MAYRPLLLHVEENSNDTHLFRQAVEKTDPRFEVVTVPNGLEAIRYLANPRSPITESEADFPTIIVIGNKMNATDGGWALLQWMRDHAPPIPIIILGDQTSITRIRAMGCGAHVYGRKSVKKEELLDLTRQIFSRWIRPAL